VSLIDSSAYEVAIFTVSAANTNIFKIDKQLLVLFEYLTISLDKIRNKKIISKIMTLFNFI